MSRSYCWTNLGFLFFAMCMAACVDTPLEPGRESGAASPRFVETISLPDGQSLLRLDLEDARGNHDFPWSPVWGELDRDSYAAQGILIDSARIVTGGFAPWFAFARSGVRWIQPHLPPVGEVTPPPIRFSFSAKSPLRTARSVRVYAAHFYPGAIDPQHGVARLTCYSGVNTVGTQSTTLPIPPWGSLAAPEYFPLEVSGDSITSCTAAVGGHVVLDDIEVVFQQDSTPKLELDCNGERGENIAVTVTRGEMLDCNIRVTPPSALRGILGWTFTGGGHVVPAADAEPYTATGWPGLMVTDGTITVRVLLGTDTVTATAQVTVEARPWVDRIAEPKVVYVSCPFPLTAECPLPEIPEHMNDFGRFDVGASSWPSQFLSITSGPNKGFHFFGGDESFLDIREPWIVLNDILRRPEHPFWASRKQCNVERFHQESLRHERRHYEGLRQAFVEGGFTRGWLESWYAFGTVAEATAASRLVMSDFQTALNGAGDLNHTNPEFLTEWHCDPEVEDTNRGRHSPNPTAPGRNRADPVP